MPKVAISETYGLRRRFNFSARHGLTVCFMTGVGNCMPSSDDLLGRGVTALFPNSELVIDTDDFFAVTSRDAVCVPIADAHHLDPNCAADSGPEPWCFSMGDAPGVACLDGEVRPLRLTPRLRTRPRGSDAEGFPAEATRGEE